jgi:hypothetical protein
VIENIKNTLRGKEERIIVSKIYLRRISPIENIENVKEI